MADGVDKLLGDAKEPADPLRLARMPRNDYGLGERFRARFEDRVAYTPELGWVAYDGERFVTDERGEQQAKRFAHETAALMREEIEAWKPAEIDARMKTGAWKEEDFNKDVRAYQKFISDAGNSGKTAAMLSQAAPYLSAKLETFDPDKFRLCVANGALEFDWCGETCVVWRRADGRIGALAGVSTFGDDPIQLGPWPVTKLPDVWEIGADTVDEADLRKGVDFGDAGVLSIVERGLFEVNLVDHSPAHRMTRMAGCKWDPKARAPKWEKHLSEVLPDEEARRFFQRAMGYSMTGATDSQCFIFVQGPGNDGKSTTYRVVAHVLGEYAMTCDPRSWQVMKQRSAADASPDIANMAGDTRLVYCEEPDKGARLNEALLKQATGGVQMVARHLNRAEFRFWPRFKTHITFNDMVRVSGGDDGFWRRVRLIRFPRQFTPAEQLAAGDVYGRLIAEAPGILNWLIEGARMWREEGLQPYPAMAEDIMQFRSASNPFSEWFATRCERKPGHRERFADLYEDYQIFMQEIGATDVEVLSQTKFGLALEGLQVMRKKVDGIRFRAGVVLKPKPVKPEGPARDGDDEEGGE